MTFERVHISSCATSNALLAANCKDVTREGMACFYADCIRAETITKKPCDWPEINAAIVRRWPKGLVWIKTQAWKKVQK